MAAPVITSVAMPLEKVNQGIELVTWYENAPAWVMFGDRFHENVSDAFNSLLPEGFEQRLGDDHFFSRFEVDGGKLVMIVGDDGGDNKEYSIEVLPTVE